MNTPFLPPQLFRILSVGGLWGLVCSPALLYARVSVSGKVALFKLVLGAWHPHSSGTEMDLEVDLWRRKTPFLIEGFALLANGSKGLSFCFSSLIPPFPYSTATPCTSTGFPSSPSSYVISHFSISPPAHVSPKRTVGRVWLAVFGATGSSQTRLWRVILDTGSRTMVALVVAMADREVAEQLNTLRPSGGWHRITVYL